MNTPPAGWYPDPQQRGQLRWWTGRSWSAPLQPATGHVPASTAAVATTSAATTPASATARRLTPAQIIGLSVVGGLLVLSAPSGAFWAMLTVVALVGAILGMVALVRGRVAWLGIRNRGIGAAVVAATMCLVLIGATANAAIHPVSPAPAAFVADAGAPSSSRTPTPSPTPTDVTTEIVELVPLPFAAIDVEDANIDVGQVVVTTVGVVGEQQNTYRVTTRAGTEVSRELVSQLVSIAPVTQVTSHGTRQPPPPPPAPVADPGGGGCDPNYEGQCVPIDSDVDCIGGSGNGPSYTAGPVYVVGSDIYDLDRDGDGVGCD